VQRNECRRGVERVVTCEYYCSSTKQEGGKYEKSCRHIDLILSLVLVPRTHIEYNFEKIEGRQRTKFNGASGIIWPYSS
jgi:hypothetical protein